jgi:Cu/Ag efflux pump CusA
VARRDCVRLRALRSDARVRVGRVGDDLDLLTALAAMIGAAVILSDPIFQGLAISLLFGLASSTLLTVLVIPAIYVVMRDDGRPLSKAKTSYSPAADPAIAAET